MVIPVSWKQRPQADLWRETTWQNFLLSVVDYLTEKIPLDDFLTVLNVVDEFRDQFPHKALLIWENEGGTNWVSYVKKELGGSLPEELDVFSIDDYSMDVKQHKQFHENIIYPMLSPHQKVFLVPGSYATRAPQNISKSICKFTQNLFLQHNIDAFC